MKIKKALLVSALLAALVGVAFSQDSQFKMRRGLTTSDTVIDSLDVRPGQRVYINFLWIWYDNAANTNAITVEIVEGMSQLATQGSGRVYKYQEAMTSGGVKGIALPLDVTTAVDSTVYVVLAAGSSDSISFNYSYKIVGP